MRRFALLLLATACSVDRAGLADFEDGGGRDAGRDCVPRGETCNELDDDCDGVVDEVAEERCGTELEVGVCTPGLYRCTSGERRCEGAVLPATEACGNGLDDDCDGDTDEDCGCSPGASEACGTSDRGECRFGSRTCTSDGIFGECLGALDASAESCNGLDDDCDGETDEGLRQPFYRDSDGDGFGSAGTVIAACSPPEGFVADDRDCNDTCRECYPGRDEVCDTLDNDCDTRVDEGLLETAWRDADR
ncbi:MAG: putative metal-binding motif-containing protein [Polyangiales bacterium]